MHLCRVNLIEIRKVYHTNSTADLKKPKFVALVAHSIETVFFARTLLNLMCYCQKINCQILGIEFKTVEMRLYVIVLKFRRDTINGFRARCKRNMTKTLSLERYMLFLRWFREG